jgi:hypothetical protein
VLGEPAGRANDDAIFLLLDSNLLIGWNFNNDNEPVLGLEYIDQRFVCVLP